MAHAESSSDSLALHLRYSEPELDGDRLVFRGPTASWLRERYALPLLALAERYGSSWSRG